MAIIISVSSFSFIEVVQRLVYGQFYFLATSKITLDKFLELWLNKNMELRTVKISPQGQITIPQQVRERCNLKPGKRVQLVVSRRVIELRPEPDSWVEAAYGSGEGLWKKRSGVGRHHAKEKESWDK